MNNKPLSLILLDRAKEDMATIADYIARESGSRKTGRDFTGRLLAKCQELARQPFPIGRLRPELGEEIRSYSLGNYILFLHYSDDHLEVITIMEGHRDIENQLKH